MLPRGTNLSFYFIASDVELHRDNGLVMLENDVAFSPGVARTTTTTKPKIPLMLSSRLPRPFCDAPALCALAQASRSLCSTVDHLSIDILGEAVFRRFPSFRLQLPYLSEQKNETIEIFKRLYLRHSTIVSDLNDKLENGQEDHPATASLDAYIFCFQVTVDKRHTYAYRLTPKFDDGTSNNFKLVTTDELDSFMILSLECNEDPKYPHILVTVMETSTGRIATLVHDDEPTGGGYEVTDDGVRMGEVWWKA